MSENVEASNSHNPKGLHGLYRDGFTLSYIICSSVMKYVIFMAVSRDWDRK
jgi:hypothetical protein